MVLLAIVAINVWEKVSLAGLPHGVKLLKPKWIFTRKYDELGNEVAKKAKLVILGNMANPIEHYGRNYRCSGFS
ncbi:hypothetical protein EON65_45855 [archaeon]|nr:MAG: hypothetical protein EON65_45855 [archaeon]